MDRSASLSLVAVCMLLYGSKAASSRKLQPPLALVKIGIPYAAQAKARAWTCVTHSCNVPENLQCDNAGAVRDSDAHILHYCDVHGPKIRNQIPAAKSPSVTALKGIYQLLLQHLGVASYLSRFAELFQVSDLHQTTQANLA